jgi:phosphatidylserine synthase
MEDIVTTQQSAPAHGLAAWAAREFKQLLVIVLYLWVIFGVYVLCETVILAKQHVSLLFHGLALINALVLSKVLLVAEDMNFAGRLDGGPLIYPILYKAFAFAVLLVAAHIGESVLVGLWHGKTAAESFPPVGGGTWPGAICVVVLMFVALIPFFAFREIGRVIGEDRLWALLFKRNASVTVAQHVT